MKAPTPQQIRTTRHAAELTQEQLARLLGVTRQTVINYEHGKTAMRPIAYEYLLLKLTRSV